MLQQKLNQFIMKKITNKLVFAVLGVTTFGFSAIAQEKTQSQTTIKIIKNENGKITKSEKVIEGVPNESIQELFEENGILDEINFTNEGSEDFEIIIRKLKNDLDHETDRFHKMVFISKDDENLEHKAFLGIYGMPSENIKIINENGNIEIIDETSESEDSKIDETIGVEVTGIVTGSPAEESGLLKGDKITKLDEIKINKFSELADFIASKKPGDELKVSYVRDGKEISQNIVLGEKKPRYSGINNMSNSFVFDYDNEIKPFLGVTLEEEVDEGIKVTEIVKNSKAEAIGLKSGDIITKINSNKITSFENLKTELSKIEVGEQITVSYLREGKKNEVSGELKSRADTKSMESFVKSYRFDFDEDNYHQNAFFSDEIRINISINNISKEEAKNLKKSTGLDLDENNLEFEEFAFAPNPTSGVFQVSFTPQVEGKMEISLFDQTGKQVYLHNINAQKQNYIEEINISEQANGIYFLVINQNNKVFSKKVIKQ